MNFEEIQMKAYKNESIDEFESLPVKYAYLRMKELYREYNYGNIQKDKCIKEKNIIRKELENNIEKEKESLNICKEYNDNRIKVETVLYELNKCIDKDEALTIALFILGKLLNDDSLADRILRKFE